MTFMKVRNCRVPSEQATSKTVLARSKELDQHRRVCSGGDETYQLGKEAKIYTMEDREKLLQELQDGMKVQIPSSSALALKADLGIPWVKLRAIRRYKFW